MHRLITIDHIAIVIVIHIIIADIMIIHTHILEDTGNKELRCHIYHNQQVIQPMVLS